MKLAALLAVALAAAVPTSVAALGAIRTRPAGLPTIDVTMDGNSISVTGSLVSGAVNVHSVATMPRSSALVRAWVASLAPKSSER